MTNNETHLSRGTTKEGKKVVGYYCKISGADCLIKQNAKREVFTECMGIPQNDWVVITSPPQKCLGIRDCEGELIFEGDRLKALKAYNPYSGLYSEIYGGFEVTVCAKESSLGYYLKYELQGIYSVELEDCKIIHPTNKEK